MQLAQKKGDLLQERLNAGWLVEHAAGSRYELAAIIVMARTMDKKIAAATASDNSADIREAFALYQRLVELLGDTPEAIRANKCTSRQFQVCRLCGSFGSARPRGATLGGSAAGE